MYHSHIIEEVNCFVSAIFKSPLPMQTKAKYLHLTRERLRYLPAELYLAIDELIEDAYRKLTESN